MQELFDGVVTTGPPIVKVIPSDEKALHNIRRSEIGVDNFDEELSYPSESTKPFEAELI
uniref:Uncharacterized protein n=1 Tax=Tetranychus urticae TaxID=32264 RepID=T1K3N8_TETUR